MQKDDALLSRARMVGHIEHVAGVYRRDGSRYIAEVLGGLARQIGMMKPEYQQPLTMGELRDLLAAEGEGAKVWTEYRNCGMFVRECAAGVMSAQVTHGPGNGKPAPRYGTDMRAWMELPSEAEIAAAKWEGA